jgi:hypothetical protein
MSLSEGIQIVINNTILKYIDTVSSKYKIDKNELSSLWFGSEDTVIDIKKSDIQQETKKDNTLLKMTKTELVELCKSKGLKISGSKQELADRILNAETNKKESLFTDINKSSQKSSPTVIKKLVEKIPSIQIRRNKFDNFVHEETGLVFNNKTQKVYGKQNSDGTVSDLTSEDIDLCNKYKFSYYIPDNLDKKSNIKDIDIKDLDDSEDVEEVEDDVDEEEYEEYEEEEEEEFYEED